MTSSHPPKIPVALDDTQTGALRCLAALMIPASADCGVPGADDDAIFADILTTIGPHVNEVIRGLAMLEKLAGADIRSLGEAQRVAAVNEFRGQYPAVAAQFESFIVRCYYRDDRVMRAIGMEPRPPFPKGFEVEAGELSLLAPVIARGKLWRDAP